MMAKPLGKHILLEFFGCNPQRIEKKEALRDVIVEASRLANATVVTDVFHNFSPFGVSGVVVIAESHVAIHTWPEYGVASVDIFSCSDKMNPQVIEDQIARYLQAESVEKREFERGKKRV